MELTQDAFDIADRYRNPVLVLGDGLIGQMLEPVDLDAASHRQPAPDLAPKSWAATGHTPTPDAPRAVINSLYIDPAVLEKHCQKLQAKYDEIALNECRWQEEMLDDAEIVLVAYGTTSRIARSAMRKCRETGIKVGLLRPITLWPFPEAGLRKTLATASKYLCFEMSMGQMVDDVRLAINGEAPVEFYGRTGGMVPTVSEMVAQIKKAAGYVDAEDVSAAISGFVDRIGKAVDDALNSPEAQSAMDRAAQVASAADAKLDAAAKAVEQKWNSPEAEAVKKQATQAVNAAGATLGEAAKAVERTWNSPESQSVRKQAEQAVSALGDALAKWGRSLFGKPEDGAKPEGSAKPDDGASPADEPKEGE